MEIVVFGLWHLGSVTAACLAELGHTVIGVDESEKVVQKLNQGEAPIREPGLDALILKNLGSQRLRFISDLREVPSTLDVLWVTIDTPVDENDRGQVEGVIAQILEVLRLIQTDATVIISSQLPAGSTNRIRNELKQSSENKGLTFCYSPENLRLGAAIEIFLNPDRIVVGIDSRHDQEIVEPLFRSISDRIEWMSVISAEMTKHAINAFLAMSVTFANEIATLAETNGADALDIARALKTDVRIGPKAYVLPGDSFAGGTLARDVRYLEAIGSQSARVPHLISAITRSNNDHGKWAQRKIEQFIDNLANTTVTLCGLVYKSGTDTLRRSASVNLGDWLLISGAKVRVFDQANVVLPEHWAKKVTRIDNLSDALCDSDVVVIGSGFVHPTDKTYSISPEGRDRTLVLDAGHKWSSLASQKTVEYYSVGTIGKHHE